MEALELTSHLPSYQGSYNRGFGKKIKRIFIEFNHALLVKSNTFLFNFYFRKCSHNAYIAGVISKDQHCYFKSELITKKQFS